MTDHREAVEVARRILDASDRRTANVPPGTSITAFSAACGDLYENATVKNTIAIARALLSLSGRVEESRKWQDISTAPKNHFPVLAWSLETGRVVAFRDVAWVWWPCPASYPLSHPPTHWQPLPDRPLLSPLGGVS